jgi:pSer/pThr/pTyr-binding forkhead associated (FHA) protein
MVPTVTLTVTTGPMKGRRLKFFDRTFLSVGRAPECMLSLGAGGDPTVSRRHCVFDIDPPEVFVRDLGSLNGTYINGLRLGGREASEHVRTGTPTQLALYHGEVVRVGDTCFCLTTSQEPPTSEPSASDEAGTGRVLTEQGDRAVPLGADLCAGIGI